MEEELIGLNAFTTGTLYMECVVCDSKQQWHKCVYIPSHSTLSGRSSTCINIFSFFFFHWRAQLHPWVTSGIVPISPGPLQSALFIICTDTAYKYRMVQFGLAWIISTYQLWGMFSAFYILWSLHTFMWSSHMRQEPRRSTRLLQLTARW